MRILASIVGLFFATLTVRSQALPVIEKEGQKYYQYTLQEGQTLSQLQALLKQDADHLLAVNPGLERGIVAGQVINVPVQRGQLSHKVAPQQTLYAISRIYEVSVDSLMKWNPNAKNGLKVGQAIIVKGAVLPLTPDGIQQVAITAAPDSSFPHKLTDTLIKHTVLEKENLYAISKRYMVSVDTLLALNKMSSSRVSPGQQILVPIQPLKKPGVPIQAVPTAQKPPLKASFEFPVAQKAHYNIAVFLPFALDSGANQNRFVAAAALDFYMGLKMALDSLRNIGLSADIHVYDDNCIKPSLEALLQDPELRQMDLIFSPLQEKQAKLVAQFAKTQGIPVVFPVQMSNELLELSPEFIAYTTPDALLVENLAAHLHQHYQNATVVLIGSPLAADQLLEQRFKAAFAAVPTSQSKLKLQEATWSNYQKFKTVGGPQLLVSFSSDRSKVQGLLKAAALDSNLLVVGQKDWIDYKELDAPEVRNQPFLVALPSYFNYHERHIVAFHKSYRRRYNADLSKMACLGYDLTLHIGKQLLGDAHPQKGLISNMQLKTTASGLYIENNASLVVTYKNAQLLAPNNE